MSRFPRKRICHCGIGAFGISASGRRKRLRRSARRVRLRRLHDRVRRMKPLDEAA
ncbi:hypothetical protein BRPE64_ACDS01800 [Caballeronia insecticola]|uniref:Uncharacterized protein n=1 Tax=Caballeronia insecticola TaxID=758793 RepID=R4WEZ8_9BURK|nr:hypothetical protein BRPE64_ACDS01800 [Caballeronia insecticola]